MKKPKPKVAVLKTSANTVIKDYDRLLKLADFDKIIKPKYETNIKVNITWQEYFPSCSTAPWQLHGVLEYMKKNGFDFKKVHAIENLTVVTDPYRGMDQNKLNPVLEKYGMKFEGLDKVEWENMKPSKILVFGKEDTLMPKMIKNSQIIHLPTFKCHGHSTITCSLKNAFGFLQKVRHHYHLNIHEILVDLLRLQQEYCKSLFSVADSTIAMDGAGPRIGVPYVKNYIIASGDLVALDAIAAKMMGFDPMNIEFIKIAHNEGLGCGDIDQIEVVGNNISGVNYHFKTKLDPVIKYDKFFRGSFLEPLIFRNSFVFRIMVFLSHNLRNIWLHTEGQKHIKRIEKTEWGKLFKEKY